MDNALMVKAVRALIDVLDGSYAWHDIQASTGLPEDRCREIETLYNLIDARYEAEKFTIFTSNNDPFKALKDMSEGRILSRIKEMSRIMEISGSDYRDKL